MEYEVENSRLAPEDLREFLPGTIEKISEESGARGLATDILLVVVDDTTNAAVSAALAGIWLAWRRRRERDLQETNSSTVKIHVTGADGAGVETTVTFHGDGGDATHTVESEVERSGTTVVQRIRITFPEGS